MRDVIRQYWKDFKDFWKSQIVVAVGISLIPLYFQFRDGVITTNSLWSNAWVITRTYAVILAVFAFGNGIRSVFLHERTQYKAKIRRERREEHRKDSEMQRKAVPSILPNLVCGTIETLNSGDFPELSLKLNHLGYTGGEVLVLSVINQIPDSGGVVADSKDTNAVMEFFTEDCERLALVEEGIWVERDGRQLYQGTRNHLIVSLKTNMTRIVALEHAMSAANEKDVTKASHVLLTLVSAHPPYKRRFHLTVPDGAVCVSESCAFCKRFVFQGGSHE